MKEKYFHTIWAKTHWQGFKGGVAFRKKNILLGKYFCLMCWILCYKSCFIKIKIIFFILNVKNYFFINLIKSIFIKKYN